MSWLWASAIAILFGAVLNSELEHQTASDTPGDPTLHMGVRGARMADTLGEAGSHEGYSADASYALR